MKTFFLALTVVSVVACSRTRVEEQRPGVVTETTPAPKSMDDQDKAGTTTLTSATWLNNDAAMDRIAMARCSRESACANVGPNVHPVDERTCLSEMKQRMWSSLRADVCPSGVKGGELEECLQAIQHESCNNPLETLSRLTQCRSSTLCGK